MEAPRPTERLRGSRRLRDLEIAPHPSADCEACRIRTESKTPFSAIVEGGPARFESNPPARFVCDGAWSRLPISFTLTHNDDEHFVYEVSWSMDLSHQSSALNFYHLYYWKKKSRVQSRYNREMKFPSNARWCDTMVSSRTGGDFNYIRRVLLNIGITITETTRRKSGM